jgi:hydrogenase maturation protease
MKKPRILIACIGNIFLGDDAFGVEVAKRLAERPLPENVKLVDFGIRNFDLTYALLDGYDVTIFVDAMSRGEAPGTLYLMEPDLADIEALGETFEAHGMNPMRVLAMARTMGAEFKKLLVVGCEPADLGTEEDGKMGLSAEVEAALDGAIEMVESLLKDVSGETGAVPELNGRSEMAAAKF